MKKYFDKVTETIKKAKYTTYFECDYCLGFAVKSKKDAPPRFIGFHLTAPAAAHQLKIELSVCPWCIKKIFDAGYNSFLKHGER